MPYAKRFYKTLHTLNFIMSLCHILWPTLLETFGSSLFSLFSPLIAFGLAPN